MIRLYYKMDYRNNYPECPPIYSKLKHTNFPPEATFEKPKTSQKEEIDGSVEVAKNPAPSFWIDKMQPAKETVKLPPEPVETSKRLCIHTSDEFLIMEIMKLRRQLKHTTLEITIKDKE